MSSARTIFLDHNSTSPASAAVRDAVLWAMSEIWGNPSSPHLIGRRARIVLAVARDQVASLAGCDPDRLVFTGGATESCNHVTRHAHRPGRPLPSIVTTTVEHSAVLEAAERESRAGRAWSSVGVDSDGIVDLESLSDVIQDGNVLVSVQWVNNETGVIQPIERVVSMCRASGALIHVDACQAFGKLRLDLDSLGADFVSLSGHKIGAPPGVGALYVADRRSMPAILVGGDQESGRRAGTENLPGISGFGAAAQERVGILDELLERWTRLQAGFESELPAGTRVNGAGAPRVPNTISATFPGVDGSALIARLDRCGLCVSQGSACHSARPEPSHVLRAMGLTEADAYATVRFSFGPETTAEELSEARRILVSELSADRGPRASAVA